MESPDERQSIQEFQAGVPGNRIDRIILRTVSLKSWKAGFEREDVVQSTRLALLSAFAEERYKGEGLTAYVERVAQFKCLSEVRRLYRFRRHHQSPSGPAWNELEEALPAPDDHQADRLRAAQVLQLLERRCFELLVLRCFDGLSYREVGEHLGMSEVNARVSVHRCLQKSREILERMERSL